MNEFNKIFGNSFFLKEELKKEEPRRKRVFYFNGTVGQWREYSERHRQDFEERDEDVRSKIWAK